MRSASLVSAILVSIFCYFSDLHTNIFARFRKILHMASFSFDPAGFAIFAKREAGKNKSEQ